MLAHSLAFNVYRLAACFLVFYTLGHTLGAVVATPRFGPESDSVVSAMKSVRVISQRFSCTWYGFDRGFGGIVSLFFILFGWDNVAPRRNDCRRSSRLRARHLGSLPYLGGEHRHCLGVLLSVAIFFSTVITVFVGIGCIRDVKAGRKSTAPNPGNRQTIQISTEVSNS